MKFGVMFLWSSVAALTALTALPAPAQEYPNKPIRVIVPVPPGSLSDTIVRRIGNEVSAVLGQPWINENRSGVNFIPGAETCRRAPGDGYTFCALPTTAITMNPNLVDDLPYHPLRDFKAVINLGLYINGVVASPKLAIKDMAALKAYALANPGKLNLGTYGPASTPNVFRHFLNERWKTDIAEVAYKGANELVAALMNGELHVTFTALGNWVDNPGDSKGHILAQGSDPRSTVFASVPNYREVGIGDFPIQSWLGFFTPAETPDAIVTKMNDVIGKIIKDRKISDFLLAQGIEPRVTSAQVFSASIATELDQTSDLVRKYKIPKIK